MQLQSPVRRGLVGVQPGNCGEQREREPSGRHFRRVRFGKNGVDETRDAVSSRGESRAE